MFDLYLFFGIYLFAFAIALLIVAYALGWRSMRKPSRCTEKTTGTVIRYSAVQYNYFSLPVVQYAVDGVDYTVVGPKFKAGVKVKGSVFNRCEWRTNLHTREDLPDVIKSIPVLPGDTAPIVSLYDLYPVDSTVEVFYDPNKPKVSYVQRYAGISPFLSFWLPLVCGILCAAGGVVFLWQSLFS